MASAAAFQSFFTHALTMARCSLRVSSSRCTARWPVMMRMRWFWLLMILKFSWM